MTTNPDNPGECNCVSFFEKWGIHQVGCPQKLFAPKDTQSTKTQDHILDVQKMVAPPPTGAQEWEKEFDAEFRYFEPNDGAGRGAVDAEPGAIKNFIRTQITAAEERGREQELVREQANFDAIIDQFKKRGFAAGAAAHHKRVVEVVPRAFGQEFIGHQCGCGNDIYCQQWNVCREKILAALTTIDPENK